jgi:hypothetical protein
MVDLKFLRAYSPTLQQEVQLLIAQGKLGTYLNTRYPQQHIRFKPIKPYINLPINLNKTF